MSENIQPLPPYKGTEPYIFISYSHINQLQALKIVERLQKDGYRVWYDEGIDPGTEWDDNIAEHVLACGYFVALISENYLASENCKDELNLAREENKQRLLVYLEDVTLPAGMRMRLNRLQAIHKYKYQSEDGFMEKLRETRGIECCLEEQAQKPVPEEKEEKTSAPEKKEEQIPAPEEKEEQISAPEEKEEQIPAPEEKEEQISAPEEKEEQIPAPEKKEEQIPAPEKMETAPQSNREENASKKSEEQPKTEQNRAKAPSVQENAPKKEDATAQGKTPYIYLCFSGKDRDKASALAGYLLSKGIHVRRAEAIMVCGELDAIVVNMIAECAHFMPLITPNFLGADQLPLALELNKSILPLYWEETELTDAFKVLLSLRQEQAIAICRSDFRSDRDFFEKIAGLPMVKNCILKSEADEKERSKESRQISPKKEEAPLKVKENPPALQKNPPVIRQEQRWEDFFAESKDVKLEPSYKESDTKPHLFIDFVQADEAKAKRIIAHLQQKGYRVAYPTKGGFLKKINVKDQAKIATVFLPLISQSYIKERGDQLDQLCSPIRHDCFIYLERCELPKELKPRLAAKDNLKIHNFLYPRNFFNALYNTHNVKRCK